MKTIKLKEKMYTSNKIEEKLTEAVKVFKDTEGGKKAKKCYCAGYLAFMKDFLDFSDEEYARLYEKYVNGKEYVKYVTCETCGKEQMEYKWQIFKNGEDHIACVCGACGAFNDYAPKVEPFVNLVYGKYAKNTPKSEKCKKCGDNKMLYKWRTFTNGEKHIAQLCESCGAYNGFVPRVAPYIDLAEGDWEPKKKAIKG
jgi:RNase P subunit RPR2